MRHKSIIAKITPATLKWARDTAGFSVEEISGKLKVKPELLETWESGDVDITIAKLRKLSTYYKRPLTAFFLPKPPKTKVLLKDFRTLPNEVRLPISSKSLILIRRARQYQSRASELAMELNVKGPDFKAHSLSENPEIVAEQIRQTCGIKIEEQFNWRDSFEAFQIWRKWVESQNILVFQLSLPVNEIRGFTFYGKGLPAIVINSKDAINAKIFTLFHEYAHILIGREGMCLPEYKEDQHSESGEIFSNHFSGAFLVPKTNVISFKNEIFDIPTIKSIARKFKVSKYVFLRRLQVLNYISFRKYQQLYEEMKRQEKPYKAFGRSTVAGRCVSEKGKRYVSMVFEAGNKGFITAADMSNYLGIKTKYFHDVGMLAMV
ncbi:MAG: ImmA/IrrE family metallo-endopeptidase [Candidatus Omnitrophica bacterium]|nr:ImmA/IrrE family metallo-endopeptidase [Candidatus Omnitrophota bacterium]